MKEAALRCTAAGEAAAIAAIPAISERVTRTEDAKEGIRSFVERREAHFTGRRRGRPPVNIKSNPASEGLIPEGFQRHTRHSGLTDPWEPIYARRSSSGICLAIRASAAHANSRGFVHGGLITALADNAMGLSCGQEVDNTSSLVTVSLSMDFVGLAKVGQWLEIRPEVIKTGKSLCFASALILAGDSVCARASGVFKLVSG